MWIAAIYVFGAIGSAVAHRFETKRPPAFIGLIVWGVLLGLAIVLPPVFATLFVGLFSMLYYAMSVLTNSYLQKHTESKTRATTTSVMSFLSGLFALAVFGVFWMTSVHGYSLGLSVIAGSILAVGGGVAISYMKRAGVKG